MTMVERLAEKHAAAKYDNRFGAMKNNPIIQFEARWWINAIVDELEGESITGWGPTQLTRWLRDQAQEPK